MQHPDRSGIERFLGVVGLPRSGTTLLTALLDAHPAIALYYEPFNASKKSRVPVPSDLRHFCEVMEGHFREGMLQGKGFIKTITGETYTGDFVDGEYHGLGRISASRRVVVSSLC